MKLQELKAHLAAKPDTETKEVAPGCAAEELDTSLIDNVTGGLKIWGQ